MKIFGKKEIVVAVVMVLGVCNSINAQETNNVNGVQNPTTKTTDTKAPVITLNGDANITLTLGESYDELGASAHDQRDGDVNVTVEGSVDTSIEGIYTITYTARDKAGNEVTVTRTVNVVAPTLTSLSLESNVTTLNVGETAELTVMATYSDGSTAELDANVEYIITPSDSAEMNGTVLRAKKDGNVTVQAKVGTTLSNTINLHITWVVNGHVLPPEPDPIINNSTLLGIDVNDNGVRDDVERWIYETYNEYVPCHIEAYNITLPDGSVAQTGREVCEENAIPYHPVVRAVAMQGARAAQIIIQEPERAKEIMDFRAANLCGLVISSEKKRKYNNKIYFVIKDSPLEESAGMITQMFNTIQRARAYGQYNFNLSGGIYKMPTDDEILKGCSEEVQELLKSLK